MFEQTFAASHADPDALLSDLFWASRTGFVNGAGYPRVACEVAEYEWIVLLDAAIETMRQMEVRMMSKYKEISLSGLPINLVEC
jgi:hypothetical protein